MSYVARFTIKDADGNAVGGVVVLDRRGSDGGFIVRREWARGGWSDSDPIETIGEALTTALDRVGLYDVVAARIAEHAIETAAVVRELTGADLYAEHTGNTSFMTDSYSPITDEMAATVKPRRDPIDPSLPPHAFIDVAPTPAAIDDQYEGTWTARCNCGKPFRRRTPSLACKACDAHIDQRQQAVKS